MTVEVKVDDSILDALDDLYDQLDGIEDVVAEAGTLHLMEHLAAKDKDGSSHKTATKLGAEPQHLYAEFARALSASTGSGKVTVSINHAAAAQRYYGGTITPKRAKHLTIPVAAEAYGKSLGAGDFTENLVWLFGRNRKPYAVALESDPEHILFILAKSVEQPADPSVLPDDDNFTTALLESVSAAIDWEAING